MAEFLKLREASPLLGIPYYKLREMAIAGIIPAIRSSSKSGTWRVNVEQVKEKLLKQAA